ncbi:hypothetical protein [Holdemania filiformis]|uniref:hypothetical protein n=1 Tax=Holdemania filiformis TaxID=61171 RepID=UPI002676E8A6|nr:hypothetical protein [Holdemania filiformis]
MFSEENLLLFGHFSCDHGLPIPLRPQSRIAERFFQIVQKAALPLNKKLPSLASTISPKAASAED